MCSCSSAFAGADEQATEDVYKAWVNTVNESGGISGHHVQLITKDDGGNPGTAATEAQALVSEHVVAVVDESLVDPVWASIIQKANIPDVGGNINQPEFGVNPDFYDAGQSQDSENVSYIDTLKAAGVTNFGVIYCVESPACAQSAGELKTLSAKSGPPLVYEASISATAPNYTAQCVAAQQKHVDSLIVEEINTLQAVVAQDCARQGYKPTYIGGGSGFGPVTAQSPALSANTWFESNNIPYFVNTPAVQTMNAALDKYYPGLRTNAKLWEGTDLGDWASGVLLADAIRAGGLGPSDTPSASEVLKGLNSLKGDTLDGLSPPLTFHVGQVNSVDCWFTFRSVNGKQVLENNGKVTCGTASS
jgi:branched-chain amino acid transport system substrate-binding protein